ncbi:2-hydroxyacid dehydrogenase [Bacillus infantis]|uniref:2-hydroxyacid dehydrogenase n=1 Tax=Bacillus infantis TaxID=324767 RepID=UPI0016536FC0|nr:D-glycerate dehydrogenase [Bacillus infantis]
MKPKVYITRKIPDEFMAKIKSECDVKVWSEEDIPVPRDILEAEIAEIDGLLCLLTENIDESIIEKASHLRVISNMAVGYNNIDIEAAKNKRITVTNTPGILTDTTADLTFALLMAASRRIIESNEFLKMGKWKTWSPFQLTGQDVYGATLGIIGMGRIGEALIKRAKGFSMNCIYYNRTRKTHLEEEHDIKFEELDHLLQIADFVCILTPYTPETKNLISERELKLMKSTSILINTARGGIVNEAALYKALTNGEIWAAGLDVFEQEPINNSHPLMALPNVVALPHIGSASVKTRMKMAELAVDNLLLGVKGITPNSVIV